MHKQVIFVLIFSFTFPFIASDVVGTNGVVVTSKQIASDVGIDIMK